MYNLKNANLDLSRDKALPKATEIRPIDLSHSQMPDRPVPDKLCIQELQEILIKLQKKSDEWSIETISKEYNITSEMASELR